MASVSQECGLVMEMTIAATTVMKIQNTVVSILEITLFGYFFWSIIADLVSCMQVIEQLPKTLLPS